MEEQCSSAYLLFVNFFTFHLKQKKRWKNSVAVLFCYFVIFFFSFKAEEKRESVYGRTVLISYLLFCKQIIFFNFHLKEKKRKSGRTVRQRNSRYLSHDRWSSTCFRSKNYIFNFQFFILHLCLFSPLGYSKGISQLKRKI